MSFVLLRLFHSDCHNLLVPQCIISFYLEAAGLTILFRHFGQFSEICSVKKEQFVLFFFITSITSSKEVILSNVQMANRSILEIYTWCRFSCPLPSIITTIRRLKTLMEDEDLAETEGKSYFWLFSLRNTFIKGKESIFK